MWVLFLESSRCQFSLSQQSYLCLQLYLSHLECFQPVHSLTAPSHALAIFSEGNWEQLHSCAVLKVGLESQIVELLGGGLQWKWLGLHFFSISSSCTVSFFSHTYFFHMDDSVFVFCKINLYDMVQLLSRSWTFGKCSWNSLPNCIPGFS